jgi:hypothetical protein
MDAELAEEMGFTRPCWVTEGRPRGGNTTFARGRAVWIWPRLESLCQDAVYASYNAAGTFTVTALLAPGSAIGLTTSLFTIFNAVALRPAGSDPSRVVMVNRFVREGGGFGMQVPLPCQHSGPADSSRSQWRAVKMQDPAVTHVCGNYFRILGVRMGCGRGS